MTNEVKRKLQMNQCSYGVIAIIIVFHYILFNFTSFLYRSYVVNSKLAYSIGITVVISLYIGVKQIVFNIVPAITYLKSEGYKNIAGVLRINKVSKKQLFISFLIFVVFNVISSLLILLQAELLKPFNLGFVMNSNPIPDNFFATIMFIISGAIICPIAEEIFFRGFLIRSTEKLGMKFAIISSAIYFALYHDNPYRLITLFLFAYLVGYIVYYTNSILPGIFFHIITNAVYVISLYVQGNGGHDETYNDALNTSAMLLSNNYVIVLVLIISSTLCFWLMKKLKELRSLTDNISSDIDIKGQHKKSKLVIITALICVTLVFLAMVF